MKRTLFFIGLMMLSFIGANAQNIIDAEEDTNPNNFYEKTLAQGRKAMPYAFLRESDVVWSTCVWRTIDFREKFNQFFYYPTQTDVNTQGRKNLANTLIEALLNGEIECYEGEDDDMKTPIDFAATFNRLGRHDTIPIAIEDEDGYETGEYEYRYIDENPSAANIFKIGLKEFWYIDKQDTRQKVRIVGLCIYYNYCKERDGENDCTNMPLCWIPMNDMRVRDVLAKVNAYDEHNNSLQRSYDEIFVSRYFDSFVTRETNRFNRSVSSYLTGQDAIYESQLIEDKIFDIESDMWEY